MIQDIGEHTFDNQYHPCPPDRESYALYYEDHAALVRKYPDRIEFPKFRDIERLNEDIYEDAVYLFSIDGERYYLVEEINRERQSHFYNGKYGDFPVCRATVPCICRDYGISAS